MTDQPWELQKNDRSQKGSLTSSSGENEKETCHETWQEHAPTANTKLRAMELHGNARTRESAEEVMLLRTRNLQQTWSVECYGKRRRSEPWKDT